MSGWQIGWVIVAAGITVALLVLSFFILAKVGGVLDRTAEVVVEARASLKRATDEALLPITDQAVTTMGHVNAQLARVDTITGKVEDVTTNISGLTAVFAAVLGGPAVKAAAFTYGVRKAIGQRQRNEVERRVRAELRRQRRRAKGA